MRVLKVNRFWPALVVALGAALVITTAASADNSPQPFYALGVSGAAFDFPAGFGDLDDGDVAVAGASGRFIVKDRHLTGDLIAGPLAGGTFTLTFGTNVPIATQSGQVHGKAVIDTAAGPIEANVQATASGGLCSLPPFLGYPALVVDGTYTFTSGSVGNGDLRACVLPIIGPDGHIIALYAAVIELSGKWKP